MKKLFSLFSIVLVVSAALLIAPRAKADPVWQPLPLETQAAYGYTHKLVLDATDCTALSSNVAAKIFPRFDDTNTVAAGMRLTSGAVKVVSGYAGNGMTAMTLKLGHTTTAGALLTCAIGTNVTANTWNVNTNTLPIAMNAATNLVLTLVPADNAGNGLLTNLTGGQIEIYIGLKDLNKL